MSFAVFLDRDGTIVVDRHYLHEPDRLELLPHAAEGLRALARLQARLVVVTNQSGVGRGYFAAETLDRVHARLVALLAERGVELDGIYACVHAPEDGCECRKPASGLFLRAAAELGIELEESFVLGDRDADVEAAGRIGATPRDEGLHAPDLLAAARTIEALRGLSRPREPRPRSS